MTYRVRNPELPQEDDLVPPWKIVLASLVVLVISAVLVVWAVSANAGHEAVLRPSGAFPEQWLGPRHRVSLVRQDIFGEHACRSLDAEQRAVLGSYGWVDQERGLVRIPVDRAMDLLLEGGRP